MLKYNEQMRKAKVQPQPVCVCVREAHAHTCTSNHIARVSNLVERCQTHGNRAEPHRYDLRHVCAHWHFFVQFGRVLRALQMVDWALGVPDFGGFDDCSFRAGARQTAQE